MDLNVKWKSARRLISKYRYVFIIVVIGLFLMLLPDKVEDTSEQTGEQRVVTGSDSVEEKLEELLGKVYGVGEVQVLLTTLSGEEIIYKTDDRGTTESINTNTVVITDSDRNQSGLVQQKNPPVYRGAVVVCTGADRADVRLAITDAVIKATGLRSDQISVLKMN